MRSRSVHRATKANLARHHANFSLDGLKFHFDKLSQYTNPSGGALDKIPLNTKNHIAAYRNQFVQWTPNFQVEPDPEHQPQPPKPIFLRKKAQYQVADHLLGIGKTAYWTGSRGRSTLLGLDIDDHESESADQVKTNSEGALQLFVEMTGLAPVPCKSPGGINAFLICHKTGMTTGFTNETWHSIVRVVNAEAQRRGLVAKLECKGKAQIFNEQVQYCGVQFKDPFYATNPTDEELHAFWDELESKPVTGIQLHGLLTTLENEKFCPDTKSLTASSLPTTNDDLLPTHKGVWAKQCREWAIHGLPCPDSIFTVTSELAKWLYFVELPEVDEAARAQQVVELLFEFCLLKHNGYVTRLNRGQVEDVKAQLQRIVASAVSRTSESGKAIFAKLRSQPHMKLVPLMQNLSPSAPFFPVQSTECGAVLDWKPAPEYRRQRAAQWDCQPDETALPEAVVEEIKRLHTLANKKINQPTWIKLRRFLNHLWNSPRHEARLGVESLRKMGFSNSRSRRHIHILNGLIDTEGYCPAAGVSKLYKLRERAVKMFVKDGH